MTIVVRGTMDETVVNCLNNKYHDWEWKLINKGVVHGAMKYPGSIPILVRSGVVSSFFDKFISILEFFSVKSYDIIGGEI